MAPERDPYLPWRWLISGIYSSPSRRRRYQRQREVPLNMAANKQHRWPAPGNPPALFSSQVLNTTTERPQSLHPYWVTNTKYHLLWYRSLSQTGCRITEMLIILLAMFLHKHVRAYAKMFWGVISMSLWSGVAIPFGVLFSKTHTHMQVDTQTRALTRHLQWFGNWWWLQIYGWQSGPLPAVTAGDLPRLPYLAPVTCYIRVAQLCAPASKDVRANNDSFRAYSSKIPPASPFIIRSALQ